MGSRQETVSERGDHTSVKTDTSAAFRSCGDGDYIHSTVSFELKLKVKVRMYRLLLPLLAVLVTITQGYPNREEEYYNEQLPGQPGVSSGVHTQALSTGRG